MMRKLVLLAALAPLLGAAAAPAAGPAGEAAMIATVDAFAARYAAAPNKMAQGALRPERARALAGAAIGVYPARGHVKDWTGTVDTLDATGDGHGILTVRVGPHVTLGTTNNALSESLAEFKTLIPPDSALFRTAVALHVGQTVRFSGEFGFSREDCMREKSLTVAGAMTEPEFQFRFDAIAPTD